MLRPNILRLLANSSLLVAAAAAGFALLGIYPDHHPLTSWLFVLAMLAVIGGALRVTARLLEKEDPLAARAVPSTLVAYLLFLLMTWRWFFS